MFLERQRCAYTRALLCFVLCCGFPSLLAHANGRQGDGQACTFGGAAVVAFALTPGAVTAATTATTTTAATAAAILGEVRSLVTEIVLAIPQPTGTRVLSFGQKSQIRTRARPAVSS